LPEELSDIRDIVHVLLRGIPGRRQNLSKQEFYRSAKRLRESKNLSYAQVARQLLPDEYAKNPQNATAKIKAGIHRLASLVTKTP
jgi:hypothetical protein